LKLLLEHGTAKNAKFAMQVLLPIIVLLGVLGGSIQRVGSDFDSTTGKK
jgi:hypothetical protein